MLHMSPKKPKKGSKDAQGIAEVASGKSQKFIVRKRGAKDPVTGRKIPKGATVTPGPAKPVLKGFQTVPQGVAFKVGKPSISVRSSYKGADYNQGKVNIRPTDMGHVKMLGENKVKVVARMKAQSEGKETYPNPRTGMQELSGIRTSSSKFTPGKVSVETQNKTVPVYGSTPSVKVRLKVPANDGKLKPRAMTYGGSDNGAPANKYGIGSKKKVTILKVKRFSPPKG